MNTGYTESDEKVQARLARREALHNKIMAEKAAQVKEQQPNLAVALQ